MGRDKIEKLTTKWFGFTVFSGAVSFVLGGIGFFSLLAAVFGIVIGLLIAFGIGRALLARISVVRWLALFFSVVGIVGSMLGALSLLAAFVLTWQLQPLGQAVLLGLGAYMHFYTLRTLMSRPVSQYFR